MAFHLASRYSTAEVGGHLHSVGGFSVLQPPRLVPLRQPLDFFSRLFFCLFVWGVILNYTINHLLEKTSFLRFLSFFIDFLLWSFFLYRSILDHDSLDHFVMTLLAGCSIARDEMQDPEAAGQMVEEARFQRIFQRKGSVCGSFFCCFCFFSSFFPSDSSDISGRFMFSYFLFISGTALKTEPTFRHDNSSKHRLDVPTSGPSLTRPGEAQLVPKLKGDFFLTQTFSVSEWIGCTVF